ncbi:hypothetical protein BDZ89DRAFT_960230, partial [Hymenopellis radicata]
ASLEHSETHKAYNIHFLCTSNLAAPLEMLNGIADQLVYIVICRFGFSLNKTLQHCGQWLGCKVKFHLTVYDRL